jgi:hypothetical protein
MSVSVAAIMLVNEILHWSWFAERLACRLALFWHRVGGPPCRWLCALPKGLYRPKLQQMDRQMNK